MKRTTFRARLAELGFRSYTEYLRSEHWMDVRRRFKASKLFNGRCAACGSARTDLHIHHRTYKRIGREWLHDLVALCGDCHDLAHQVERPGLDLWKATRRVIHAGHQRRRREAHVPRCRGT